MTPDPRPADPLDPAGQDADAQRAADVERIAGIEALLGIGFTQAEREQMQPGLRARLARFAARRRMPLPENSSPACGFDPFAGGAPPSGNPPVRLEPREAALPVDPEDLAFAPVLELAHWLRTRQLKSLDLTELLLRRIERLDGRLKACILVTAERARAEARVADEELDAGAWRGLLHGVPYGAKDLFDTADIATTFGAEPFVERLPASDAAVVERLGRAGAVLLAKTSLGALAYGDLWFGGRTRNPWNLEQGSSGSSAGSAAGVAAGLFPFALGTETYGSIVSPCMRCGATGLRPTFGRVPRTGAMALCWSLDKVGPIARRVEDTLVVLEAIQGPDVGDPASRTLLPLGPYPGAAGEVLRVGLERSWFERAGASERAALAALERLPGVEITEVALPEGPWSALLTVLEVEAAVAFEDLTRSDRDDELGWQDPEAWPNTFRSAWLVPAPEFLAAERLRGQLVREFGETMRGLDAIFAPSFAADLLLITNFTGHPSLTLRVGFEDGAPQGATLFGALAGESRLVTLGALLERELDVHGARPDL